MGTARRDPHGGSFHFRNLRGWKKVAVTRRGILDMYRESEEQHQATGVPSAGEIVPKARILPPTDSWLARNATPLPLRPSTNDKLPQIRKQTQVWKAAQLAAKRACTPYFTHSIEADDGDEPPAPRLPHDFLGSVTYQRALYAQWEAMFAWDAATSGNLGLWAEVILMQVFAETAHVPSPCHLRTATCCFLLTKLCSGVGSLRRVMNIVVTEIFNGLFANHKVDLTERFRAPADAATDVAPAEPPVDKRRPARVPPNKSINALAHVLQAARGHQRFAEDGPPTAAAPFPVSPPPARCPKDALDRRREPSPCPAPRAGLRVLDTLSEEAHPPGVTPCFVNLTTYAAASAKTRARGGARRSVPPDESSGEEPRPCKRLGSASVASADGVPYWGSPACSSQAVAQLAAENMELKKMLLGCHFRAWKNAAGFKKPAEDSNSIVAVVKAANGRKLVAGCFKRWRHGVTVKKRLTERKRMVRLGVKYDLSDTDSEAMSELPSPTTRVNKLMMYPSDRKSRVKIVESENHMLTVAQMGYVGRVGELDRINDDAALVEFPSGSTWFPTDCLEFLIPATPVHAAQESHDDVLTFEGGAGYSKLTAHFFVEWLNELLAAAEEHTKVSVPPVLSLSDLADCEAIATVALDVFDVDGRQVPQWSPTERANAVIRSLPSSFPCKVTVDTLVNPPSEHAPAMFLVSLFEVWVNNPDSTAADSRSRVLPSLLARLGIPPQPGDANYADLLATLRQLVWNAILSHPSHRITYPIDGIDLFRQQLVTASVAAALESFQPGVEALFVQTAGDAEGAITFAQLVAQLERLEVLPGAVSLEAVFVAFAVSQASAASKMGGSDEESLLDMQEYRDVLCLLHLWMPSSTADKRLETAERLAEDLRTFLTCLLEKARMVASDVAPV
ncbi:hypothetical protein DIPPA_02716 [Diplonema papillatum]|nr:hypothetical protein DIPPA_02716 [Diplonema papillatum]|eukprot:gene754-1162_t